MGSAETQSRDGAALAGDALKGGLHASVHPRVALWGLLLLAVATFWPTLAALSGIWLHVADYQYGPLAAGISLWLFHQEATRVGDLRLKPQPLAVPILAAALLVWVVAYRANSDMLQQLLFPFVLLISIWAAMGLQIARRMAFPVGYFLFAIPLWDHFVPALQWMTTHAAENVLAALGVPTIVDGHQVTIPEGKFSIIEGCSGKRYFIVGLSFAALLAAVLDIRRARLVAVLAGAAVIAILVNWLRVVIVIYTGHVSNMQHYLVAVEHKSLGYALFVPTLLAILWLGKRLASPATPDRAPSTVAQLSWSGFARCMSGPVIVFVTALILLGATRATHGAPIAIGPFPVQVDTWQGPLPAHRGWQPEFAGASAEQRASYADASGRIEVYVNAFGVQARGHELVAHGNVLAPAHSWTSIGRRASGVGLTMSMAAHESYGRWLFASMYVVDGRMTSSPVAAQFLYGVSALRAPAVSGVVAMATPCPGDCSAEAERVEAFWTENSQALAAMIPGTYSNAAGSR